MPRLRPGERSFLGQNGFMAIRFNGKSSLCSNKIYYSQEVSCFSKCGDVGPKLVGQSSKDPNDFAFFHVLQIANFIVNIKSLLWLHKYCLPSGGLIMNKATKFALIFSGYGNHHSSSANGHCCILGH